MAGSDGSLITKASAWSLTETVARLRAAIAARGMNVVSVIDLGGDASGAELRVRETSLVLFSDAAISPPIIDAAPLTALDFPLWVLVWTAALGTNVTYLEPAAFASQEEIARELVSAIESIDEIVDAVIDR